MTNSLFLFRAVAFANLDFVSLTPMGCVVPITYHHQLLGYTLLPLVAFAALLALYKVLSARASRGGSNESRDQVFNTFLVLTFFVLPTTSTKILNTFACDEFDDGTRWLKGDLSIDCDSATHKFFEYGRASAKTPRHRFALPTQQLTLMARCLVCRFYAAGMILVFPVGIPAMYFALLYKSKGLLDRGQAKLVNTKMIKLVEQIKEETGAVDKEEVGDEEKEVLLVSHVCDYITDQGEIEEAVKKGDIILEDQWLSSLKDEHKTLLEFVAKESNVCRIFWHFREGMETVLGVEVILSEEGAKKEALRRRAADEEAHSKLGRMKFLYQAYEPKCWW